jgi:hypothetical protein
VQKRIMAALKVANGIGRHIKYGFVVCFASLAS